MRSGTLFDRAVINVDIGVGAWAGSERRKRGRGDKRIQEIAAAVKNTFEPVILTHLYPRSEINIYIQVLSMDGGDSPFSQLLSSLHLSNLVADASLPLLPSSMRRLALLQTAINATTLALLTSGISLTDSLISLTLGHLTHPHPTLLLDLTTAEESDLPHVVLGFLPRSGKITTAELEGRMSVETMMECVRLGGEAVGVLKREMERALKEWGGIVGGSGGIEGGVSVKKVQMDSMMEDEDDAMD
jgi:exosome complex component RRP41